MRWMRRWVRRLAYLLRKERAEAELDEELRAHLEMEIRDRVEKGMDPDEARRTALRDFGGVERHKEKVRNARGTRLLDDLAGDLRHALRTLRRSPGFAVVALLTLALGIGVTTALFSVVDSVLLEPLPYDRPHRLVRVHASWDASPVGGLSPGEFVDFRERLSVFDRFGVYGTGSANLTGSGEPVRVRVGFVTSDVLPALGVDPALGRHFRPEEGVVGARVALLSHGFWERRFGADGEVLGRTLELDGRSWQVVGVLPPGGVLPETVASGRGPDLFAPTGWDPAEVQTHGSHFLASVARLEPGATLETARGEVERVGTWMRETFSDEYGTDMSFGVMPLEEVVVGDARPALLALLGAAAFVLLISCVNTANLLLARSQARRKDFALRSVLGAGRGRLVRQILVESLVLGGLGGALGLLVAAAGVEGLVALQPPDLPRLSEIRVDRGALAFALAVSVLTGLAFGLLPALRTARGEAGARALRDEGRGSTPGRRGLRGRRILVVAELALAAVLLAGAGLTLRSFRALLDVDPGFRAEGVLTTRVSLPGARYATNEEVVGFFHELVRRLEGQPGVRAAGAAAHLPLENPLGDMGILKEGEVDDGDKPAVDWETVTVGYFRAAGMTLVRGRFFREEDGAEAPGVAVISESMARWLWPDEDPLGRRFLLGGGAGPGWVTVVGIARDVRYEGLGSEARPQFWVPHRQFRVWGSGAAVPSMALLTRTGGDPVRVADQVRRVVRQMDPDLPLTEFRTLEEVRGASVARPRLLASLVTAFGVLALILAGVGVYGVVSYGVRRRTAEFGIRMALGADGRRVRSLVLRESALLILVGLGAGALAVPLVVRPLGDLLYRVGPGDPVTLGGVAVVLASVALLASWLPARRATRVDPMESLRSE